LFARGLADDEFDSVATATDGEVQLLDQQFERTTDWLSAI
jgi:hypothetical protein